MTTEVRDMVLHLARVAHSLLREKLKRSQRSPHWRSTEHRYLRSYPLCAACGGKKLLQVHHIRPYHLHPELELDEHNLIGLCMGPHECHLRIGHGGSFKAYNPNVASDAAIVLANPSLRREYEGRAKKSRATV